MKSELVINDLLGYTNLKIVQNPKWFSFSLDSVLLPNFVTIPKNTKKIVDLGTGNAPIPIILSTKTNAHITGIELQEEVYKMAKESIKMNNLESKITLINDDMKRIGVYFEKNTIDIITVNPPYFKLEEKSKINEIAQKQIARHEVAINLKDIIQIARIYLKNNGIFAMVHRTERLIEILELFRSNNIEPKRIQFIHPKENEPANMLLIEGRKNARPGLKVLAPLYAHNDDGEYTDVIKQYFTE